MPFLPMTSSDLRERGWKILDFIVVTGDAYIDHPAFGAAIIARYVESLGYKVGVIAQPDCNSDTDWLALGAPRLGFGVTAGNMDSMVNHYTAQKRIRHSDAYSPNGHTGLRPDRATIIYCNKIRQLFKNIPIIIGGIEASLRRIAHYDFWQDKVRNSILADAKADILVYGMGEKPIAEILSKLDQGIPVKDIIDVQGTVVFAPTKNLASISSSSCCVLPDSDKCSDKQVFYQMTKLFIENYRSQVIYQKTAGRYIKHNPPSLPLSMKEMDYIYALPYMNSPHPKYEKTKIPAWEQIKHSITSHRGCVGGCNFCALGLHQGKTIQSRSETSIYKEVERLSTLKHFHGTITDIGGPSANMYNLKCKQNFPTHCKRLSCLFPEFCPNLIPAQQSSLKLLKKIKKIKNIKHIFIASGIRFDLALKEPEYIQTIALSYTGGKLKLAPEHCSPPVLDAMGKPDFKLYLEFCQLFFQTIKKIGKKAHITPYIIVGHPGTTINEALELHDWLKKNNLKLEQIQEFTPTPMTISTCMYYTGLNFFTGKPIYVPKGKEVKKQKKLALWYLTN